MCNIFLNIHTYFNCINKHNVRRKITPYSIYCSNHFDRRSLTGSCVSLRILQRRPDVVIQTPPIRLTSQGCRIAIVCSHQTVRQQQFVTFLTKKAAPSLESIPKIRLDFMNTFRNALERETHDLFRQWSRIYMSIDPTSTRV